MSFQKLIASVDKIVVDKPGKWQLIYVPGGDLKVSTLPGNTRFFGSTDTIPNDKLDATVKNKLRSLLALAMNYAPNQTLTQFAGFHLIDPLTGQTVRVEYNNGATVMSTQYNDTRSLQPIYTIADEIVSQFLHDPEFKMV